MYKPKGYTSAAPYLIVKDARATLAFLKAVFDASELRVIPCKNDDGIMHAEARIDDTVIMIGEMPNGPDANIHVYVADPETTFQRALNHGGTEIQPLTDSGDGDLRGGVKDGDGTTWWIAKQLG
ncbi:MAG: VOC family protein [Sulfitobacter sp.]